MKSAGEDVRTTIGLGDCGAVPESTFENVSVPKRGRLDLTQGLGIVLLFSLSSTQLVVYRCAGDWLEFGPDS